MNNNYASNLRNIAHNFSSSDNNSDEISRYVQLLVQELLECAKYEASCGKFTLDYKDSPDKKSYDRIYCRLPNYSTKQECIRGMELFNSLLAKELSKHGFTIKKIDVSVWEMPKYMAMNKSYRWTIAFHGVFMSW